MKNFSQAKNYNSGMKCTILGLSVAFIAILTIIPKKNVFAYENTQKSFSISGIEITYKDSSEVYTIVDEMPEIIGGLSELNKHVRYPSRALDKGIEGRVFVQFIVDEQGIPRNPEIMRDIGSGCGEAALAAVEKVRFTPGKWVVNRLKLSLCYQ